MSKTIDFDFVLFCDKSFSQMKSSYDFCFTNKTFQPNRVHQTLCRFNVFYDVLFFVASKTNKSESQNLFVKQILASCKLLEKEKEWAYPEKNLNDERSFSAINSLYTVIDTYNDIIKLSSEGFKDLFSIDIVDLLENISSNNYYSYAYPDNYYSENKAHASIQMLTAFCSSINNFLDCLKTDDADLNVILTQIKKEMTQCHHYLNEAYPDNSFRKELGHQSLKKYIENWKELKTNNIPLLKTYFNTQNIFSDYQKTISEQSVNDLIIPSTESEERKPLIKKIKSML